MKGISMDSITTRIAPSPSKSEGKTTSGLHLGNVRTALFNYLFAKQNNGNFLFRIENTDIARCSETGADDILSELNWLGLSPTIGYGVSDNPNSFTQLGRLEIYKKYVDQLLAEGKAYKCYCSADDLEKQRAEALAKNPKAPFKYPGTCRNAKSSDKDYVIRLKTPNEGEIVFEDLVFGKVVIPNKENYDFVIFRQNGIPLFNFANAIDDFFIDNVSHVIRGRDHLANTAIQMLIGLALGVKKFPIYAHLPMMLGKAGNKLSKRDGAVSVREFKEAGYAPKAILNYLSRFGWSSGNQEVFSIEELISKFNLFKLNKSDGKFDYKKFEVINFEHLKSTELLSDDEYIHHLQPFLNERKLSPSREELSNFLKIVRPRAKTFKEAAEILEPLISKEINFSAELLKKTFNEENSNLFKEIKQSFEKIPEWNENSLKGRVQDYLSSKKLSLKDVGATMRVGILGQQSSPELFSVLAAMGRDATLKRMDGALEAARQYGLI